MILVWRLFGKTDCPFIVGSIVRCGWIAVAVGIFCTVWTGLGKWFDKDDVYKECIDQVSSRVADKTAVCRHAQKQSDTLYVLLWIHFIAYFVAGVLALGAMRQMNFFDFTGWKATCPPTPTPVPKLGLVLLILAAVLYGLTAGTSFGVIAIMDQMGQARKQWGTVAVEAVVAYMALGDVLALWALWKNRIK